MSKAADTIDKAHKAYAAAIGTPRERQAYEHLRQTVARVTRKSASGSARQRAARGTK